LVSPHSETELCIASDHGTFGSKLGDAKLPRELVLRREQAGRNGATECWYLFTKADSTLWVEYTWSRPGDDNVSAVGSETAQPEQIFANNDDDELCEKLRAAIARRLSRLGTSA